MMSLMEKLRLYWRGLRKEKKRITVVVTAPEEPLEVEDLTAIETPSASAMTFTPGLPGLYNIVQYSPREPVPNEFRRHYRMLVVGEVTVPAPTA